MTMFENLREDRRNMRNDLTLAVSEGKISEETAKELIEKYDSRFLDIYEKLSTKYIHKIRNKQKLFFFLIFC